MDKAILNRIGVGAARDIPVEDLFSPAIDAGHYGLSDSDRALLKALKEFCIRYSAERPCTGVPVTIRNHSDAADLMYDIFRELDHEQVWAVFMTGNTVIDRQMLFVGGLDQTVIDRKRIIRTALDLNANALILFHNHPSGNCRPSDADIRETEKLGEVCKVFDIRLLDHIIVTPRSYFSFSEESAFCLTKTSSDE